MAQSIGELRSNLQQSAQNVSDPLQHFVGNAIFRLDVAHPPVQALDLIGQNSRLPIGQQYLKRIALNFQRHGTSEKKAGFCVVRCGAQNKSRPFSGLLMTNRRIKINPNSLSSVGNPFFYQTSAPTRSPQRSSPCRFSGVILATSSSNVSGRLTAFMATSPCATTSSTTVLPSWNPASSATCRGILIAKLFPHRLICALAVIASPPIEVTIHPCRYNVYTLVVRSLLLRKGLKNKGITSAKQIITTETRGLTRGCGNSSFHSLFSPA